VHQIRFWPGLCPRPHWRSLQRSPRPLADLRGHISKGHIRGRKGKERGRGGRKENGRGEYKREGKQKHPLYQFLHMPLVMTNVRVKF